MSSFSKIIERIQLGIDCVVLAVYALIAIAAFTSRPGSAVGDFVLPALLITSPWLIISLAAPYFALRNIGRMQEGKSGAVLRVVVYSAMTLVVYGIAATLVYMMFFGNFS